MQNMRSPDLQYESDTDFTTKKKAALPIEISTLIAEPPQIYLLSQSILLLKSHHQLSYL